MVMAGTEGVSGPVTEEPLSSRLQWLRQRREALQDKLTQKNNELKSLCVEEAELTGVLPPEIPLEPGESPPTFLKRVGTSFTYPQNLVNKLKTNEAEESALELERQVQIGIKETALAIINDSTENKAVRRKHRLIYQQSKQRLQEIDACLNFVRQSHGSSNRHTQAVYPPLQNSQILSHNNSKHRTKKPRPPLDNLGRERNTKVETRGSLQDQGGISLSPLGPEHNYNVCSRELQDMEGQQFMQPGSSNPNHNRTNYISSNPVDPRRSNSKFIEHDLNVNNNIYILPDQLRSRTYSQGAQSASPRRQGFFQDMERPYRPVPNTFTEEERQYRQMQLQKLELHSPPYSEYRYLDNHAQRRMAQTQYYESEYSSSRYEHSTEYQSYGKAPLRQHRRERDHTVGISGIERKHHSALQPNVDSYLPPGHWMRLDDEIVWCPDEQSPERFGSLDRRKHSNLKYYPNSEMQSRYHTAVSGSKNSSFPRHPSQVPVSPVEHSPSSRILLRTQSLGSVETWHTGHDLSDKDQIDNISHKGKEKEWYETSLDSGCSPNTISVIGSGSLAPSLVRRPSQNNPLQSPPVEISLPIRESLKIEPLINRRPRELPVEEQPQCLKISPNHYHERPKVLEIPAESNPSQENGNDPILNFNSPTNHTVVQQGKYQPYREVTKPFEMSDFYKYSTKFRKRNEVAFAGPNASFVNTNETVLNHTAGNEQTRRVSPVQVSNYQSAQRKPQPYVLR